MGTDSVMEDRKNERIYLRKKRVFRMIYSYRAHHMNYPHEQDEDPPPNNDDLTHKENKFINWFNRLDNKHQNIFTVSVTTIFILFCGIPALLSIFWKCCSILNINMEQKCHQLLSRYLEIYI